MDKQVSLCIIKKNEWKDNYSLRRIADLHEEKLEKASFPNGKYKWLYYDNRTAPTIEDMVGFWEWKETIQQRYGEEKVWIQSDYLEECAPIEVWFPIGLKIGRGIFDNVWKIPARIHGSFLMAEKPETSGRFQAVLCCLDDCQITPTSDGIYQNISLRNDIYTLPYYVFYLGRDIISWKENLKGDDKRYFFNRIKLGEAQGRVVTHSPMRTIQKEMESWLKGQSISQNDRRTFKRIMQMIPPASIAEKLQEKYEIPEDDAQKWVQSFLQQTVSYIDMNDIDADLVANVILNHPKLRDAAEVKMEKQWVEANQKKIAEGEKRCEQLKLVKEKLNEQIAQYQKELTIKQKECSDLNQDIGQYKVLREEVREETRKNLEEIRGHMGKFLADYAAFNAAPAVSAFASKACGWKWRMENDVGISTAEADKAKNWEDILDGVIQNLSCSGVASEWEDALGAYLYAAYVRHTDLLLAGPHGRAIADALAMAAAGRKVPLLSCHGNADETVLEEIRQKRLPVLAVENPFHPEWLSLMAEVKEACPETMFIWLHPFTEDLAIEPMGLYNYVLPVFTECFVNGDVKPDEMMRTAPAENFSAYKDTGEGKRLPEMKAFHLSPLTYGRLQTVIGTAAAMLDDAETAAELEFMMGKLPFAVLTGKRQLLQTDGRVSREIQEAAARYREEDEE